MKKLKLSNDRFGQTNFAIDPSDTVATRVLTASAAKTVTVPAGATQVVYSATDDFYVNDAGAAAVPSVDSDTGTTELNPTVRNVQAGNTLSVISPYSCVVTFSFYG